MSTSSFLPVVAIVGGGFSGLQAEARGDVTERLLLGDTQARWANPIGRFGYAARGIAFLIIGGFLIVAAWYQRSSEVKGLAEAFALLRRQEYGAWLLGLVAAGHVAFGAFGLIQARYRHIDAPDIDEADEAAARAIRDLT